MRGFSLVELSIVLVILGLLVGGILAGRSLIRASELRAVVSEQQRFLTATRAFQDKYLGLPGDFAGATRLWGDQATGTYSCADATITDGSPGTCNGDANSALGLYREPYRFWQHLQLAGLMEGTFSGKAGPDAGQYEPMPGENTPTSKLSNGMWIAGGYYNTSGDGSLYSLSAGNYLAIGAKANTMMYPSGGLFYPEEAWNIDTKTDDGKPGTGQVVARGWNTCTTSSSATDFAGNYYVSIVQPWCQLFFIRQF